VVTLAEQIRDWLVPVLAGGLALVFLLLALMLLQRVLRGFRRVRREALERRYRPLVTSILSGEAPLDAAVLRRLPARHHRVFATLIIAPLHVARGEYNVRGLELANHLRLIPAWRHTLTHRHWWRRAEAGLALGLVRDRRAVSALIRLLDDEHEQVRAAAIDALGLIGDPAAIEPLVARIKDPSHHERARVVEALRAFGASASDELVALGDRTPETRVLAAAVLTHIGTATALDSLLAWSADPDGPARAAAWHALAAIGPHERAYYHAVKALSDPFPAVRAGAARVLGRVGRVDGSAYLARLLDDDWDVAAQAARALGRLGLPGHQALQSRTDGAEGPGRDLARQVLWEIGG
jgi:hypothetical protein